MTGLSPQYDQITGLITQGNAIEAVKPGGQTIQGNYPFMNLLYLPKAQETPFYLIITQVGHFLGGIDMIIDLQGGQVGKLLFRCHQQLLHILVALTLQVFHACL